jgi:hypothetical protein
MSRRRRTAAELCGVADLPDRIDLERHRELRSPAFFRPVRYAVLAALVVLLALGLANVFGQRPETHVVDTAQVRFKLYAPSHLRGGLLYEARFTIEAHADVKNALLQLSPGWNEGMQLNTIEPSPVGEASRNGDLLFTLGHIPAGTVHRLFLEFQTNPTNVGRKTADATLYDGATKLARIHRTVTVFP